MDAFLDRYWFLLRNEQQQGPWLSALERTWDEADDTEKADLLRRHIARIVLVPRRPDQPRMGSRRRDLDIEWRDAHGQEPREPLRKSCSRCGERKPVAQFQANHSKHSGLAGWCRACSRIHDQERSARKREVRATERLREERAHRARSYWAEWHAFQERLARR
jgi:hypothetical protein